MQILTCIAALSTLLSDTQSSYQSELQTKQSLIDQTHTKLRESTAALAQERRRLEEHQRTQEERGALRQRVHNLRLANERKRAQLLAMNTPTAEIRTDIKVGEADAGLDIDISVLGSPMEPFVMTPEKRACIANLPPTAVLKARATAYRKHNARLEEEAKILQSQSGHLESQLRKIVNLSTGIPEDKVDEMVDGLIAAVASEGGEDVEVARVRQFLMRVEGESGD